jgi:hypothetical protein
MQFLEGTGFTWWDEFSIFPLSPGDLHLLPLDYFFSSKGALEEERGGE